MRGPITLLLLLLYVLVFPQAGIGILSSNYAGVSTVKFNPAIADNNLKFDMNLGACYINGSNNAGGIPFNDFFNASFTNNFFSADIRANSLFSSNIILPLKTRSSYFFYKSTEVQGPLSFMLNFGKLKKHAIAVGYNYNVVKNFTADDPNLVHLASSGQNLPVSFFSKNFSARSLSWVDLAITYSGVLFKSEKHLFKGGVTAKYIMGTGYVNTVGEDMSFTNFNNGSGEISGNITHNQSANFLVSNNETNFGVVDLTSGFAADLGFVYEWRPKIKQHTYQMDSSSNNVRNDVDLYTLRFAFSATDLGFVDVNTQNLTASSVSQLYTRQTFNDVLQGNLNPDSYNPANDGNNASFIMPMRFNLSLDYNIYKGLGLNLMARVSPVLKNLQNYVRHPSSITFTPRFDRKWVGVYLPLSYDFNNNVSLGIAARLGPVFFGFDNLLMFSSKGVFNAGGYIGAKIPIHYRKPKDKDGDKVSDLYYDKCLGVVGTWSTKGCADTDGDGIANFEDKCPADAGNLDNMGCPDRDGDGVMDMQDKCPDNYGLVAFAGCPDTDGDGVIDTEDTCVSVAGLVEFHGCPDTDKDGVPDNIDPCEYEKGPKENNGCPFGDSDNDGVLDNEDSCMFVFGDKLYAGCPKATAAKRTDLQVCMDTLFFDTYVKSLNVLNAGKLDILAKQLRANVSNNVRIIGYVDDSECSPSEYEFLSKERARAVYIYLLEKGIERNRLSHDGYGNENPVGDKKTWSGKRKNRRVEIYFQVATSY